MPRFEILRNSYDTKLSHDTAPEACASCPNLEVSVRELGEKALHCRLVPELTHVGTYERTGVAVDLEKGLTAGSVYDLLHKDVVPFEDASAPDTDIVVSNPWSKQYISHAGKVDEISIFDDFKEVPSLRDHMMAVIYADDYASRIKANIYRRTTVDSIANASAGCPVIESILDQVAKPGARGSTQVTIKDPIERTPIPAADLG